MDKYIGWYRRIRQSAVEEPRGLKAYTTRNQTFGYTPLQFIRRNGGCPAIGIMEGLQLIAGVFDKDAIIRIAPKAKHELFTLQMAYGPRIHKQLDSVIKKLVDDPATRQAIILIASPDDKLDERPCTLAIQFHAQPDANRRCWYISSTAFMRSSDAIWGMPYDIIQFGMLTQVVANMFSKRRGEETLLGNSTIMVGNAHMYVDTDPAINSRPWFKTMGPMVMPTFQTLSQAHSWALKSIKQAKVAGDLYRQFEISEMLL